MSSWAGLSLLKGYGKLVLPHTGMGAEADGAIGTGLLWEIPAYRNEDTA